MEHACAIFSVATGLFAGKPRSYSIAASINILIGLAL
jgi:hypothetical protein